MSELLPTGLRVRVKKILVNYLGGKRPEAEGLVVEVSVSTCGDGAAYCVVHTDGSRAWYDSTELEELEDQYAEPWPAKAPTRVGSWLQ